MTLLRKRMLDNRRLRNLAPQTRTSYLEHVARFARHFHTSPEALGPEDIRTYQVYLTTETQLAPSTIGVSVAALRFLYIVTLKKDWTINAVLPRAEASPDAAGDPEPRRSAAVPRHGGPPEPSGDLDFLLRGRAPDFRSRPPAGDRHR